MVADQSVESAAAIAFQKRDSKLAKRWKALGTGKAAGSMGGRASSKRHGQVRPYSRNGGPYSHPVLEIDSDNGF